MPPSSFAAISELEEEASDYDWFAVDREGRVGHFTTGGFGVLPRSVAASSDDHKAITEFFRSLPVSSEASLAPKAQEAAKNPKLRRTWTGPMSASTAATHCFEDFVQMASREVFSFDHSYGLDCSMRRMRPCPVYYLIARPSNPLHVATLPLDIRTVLNRTVLSLADF